MTEPKAEIPVPESLIGLMVDGRYEISAKLGEGGIGAVFLARDRKMMNRAVVIKVLLENWLDNPEIRRKFEHEKEALSRLDHPGIVSILDAGTLTGNKPYLVMPFAPGLTLEQILKDGPTPPVEFTADVVESVADALSVAHSKGVLHRDVKPENIIIDRSDVNRPRVRLIDFGIARVFDSQISPVTHVERSIGTVWFVAPEQLLGSIDQTTATDVFSLAVVAFLMLTGQRPFDPKTVVEMAFLHKEGPKKLPSQISPGLSPAVDEIIGRALQYDPGKRPADVAVFGRTLAGALRGVGKTATGPIAVGHTRGTPTLPVSEEMPRPADEDSIEYAKTWLPPEDVRVRRPHTTPKRKWVVAGLAALMLIAISGIAAAGYLIWNRNPADQTVAPGQTESMPEQVAQPAPARLRISFTLQGRDDAVPRQAEVPSLERVSFRNDEELTMRVEANQNGNLYIFNEDDLGQQRVEFNMLFPAPDYQDGFSQVSAGQPVITGQTFKGDPGVEVVWFIWTPGPNRDLEEARINALKNTGKVKDKGRAEQLRRVISEYSPASNSIASADGETTITGSGKSIIYRLELEHR